ncbi:MAG: hypothetical protein F4X98_17310 [Gammaproteobacteria bacterium]|nr:hypothetical protein [Gammaproteobacteria bacterium]
MKQAMDESAGERAGLDFENIVRERFSFLSEFGFSEVEAGPTIIRYRKGRLGVNVYHGRRSYEIGVELVRGRECFSIELAIGVVDRDAYRKYRVPAARTKSAIIVSVERQACVVRTYAEPALRGKRKFFRQLESFGEANARRLAVDSFVAQVRPKAAEAFRERRYADAVTLYESMCDHLTVAESAKLKSARRRQ